MVWRGDIADDDAAQILGQPHRERFSGQVAFLGEGAEKIVYLEEGRPVFAASNQEPDRMGALLYREGKITSDRLADARERVAQSGRRMGEILVELGYLKRRELLPAVRRHVEDLVYSVFSWDAGRYVVSSEEGAAGFNLDLSCARAKAVGSREACQVGGEAMLEKQGLARLLVPGPRSRQLVAVNGLADVVSCSAEQHQVPAQLKDRPARDQGVGDGGGDVVDEDEVGDQFPALELTRGVKILVPARDAERARELLRARGAGGADSV